MILMHVLRMLADVAFYGAFAGFFAVRNGGSGAFLGVLIQCLCFGLSWLGGKKRPLRLILLLPMLLCWAIYRNNPADCMLLLPTAAYIIWLVWKGDYVLEQERQQRLFGVFWKGALTFAAIAVMVGCTAEVTAVTMPYTLVMLVCSVLLMRALRHDKKIYCQRKYQLLNAAAVAVVVALAGVFSSKAFLSGCALLLKTVYDRMILPVLEVLLNGLMFVVYHVVRLFSLDVRREQTGEDQQLILENAADIWGESAQHGQPHELLRVLGWLLLAAAVIALLVVFFRWMNKRSGYTAVQSKGTSVRETITVSRREAKKRETSPVRRIRALYRGFLKWCAGLGIQPEPGSTSLDVHESVSAVSDCGTVSAQIRELYIQARYADQADQDSVRKMKELCSQVKKSGTNED